MFEQTLLDLHQVLDKARAMVREYEKRLSDIKDREAAAAKCVKDMESKAQELEARKAECDKVENAIQLHKDGIAALEASHLRLNEAAAAEVNFKQYVEEQNSKLREAGIQQEKIANNNTARVKAIDQEVANRVKEILTKMGITTT